MYVMFFYRVKNLFSQLLDISMATQSTLGNVSVKLHPLVIMNISDHWTRVKSQEGSAKPGKMDFVVIPIFPIH